MPIRHASPPPTLDIDVLRAFATLVDTGSFTRTGELLGRTQSAVSVQIKRLEDQVGTRLCDRSGRNVVPTPAGEQLLGYARRILSINDEAVGRLVMAPVRGTVRIGTAEEFATQFLSDILAEFSRSFPTVTPEITVDTSAVLQSGVEAGLFDLVLVKHVPGEDPGTTIWREPLHWVARADWADTATEPVPLAVSPAPCLYRLFMLAALGRVNRSWEIRCTSTAVSALQAAVSAGLGVTALARSTILPGMRVLTPDEGFPMLPDSAIALVTRSGMPAPAADRLTRFILDRMAIPHRAGLRGQRII
jgi:DNA-binding transcriptional LysR family regulator